VPPDKLVTVGTCFGKFTKTGKFILHITALTYLAPYAQVRVHLKSNLVNLTKALQLYLGVGGEKEDENFTIIQ
jgi:ribosome biogenesis protein Nip4